NGRTWPRIARHGNIRRVLGSIAPTGSAHLQASLEKYENGPSAPAFHRGQRCGELRANEAAFLESKRRPVNELVHTLFTISKLMYTSRRATPPLLAISAAAQARNFFRAAKVKWTSLVHFKQAFLKAMRAFSSCKNRKTQQCP